MGTALRTRWPEYLIEAWALGVFMVSAAVFTVLLEYPGSPLHAALPDGDLRRILIGAAMGLTAVVLIRSPWGMRSGAHMNPAVTLAYLALGKVSAVDAAWYVASQCIGGALGALAALWMLGSAFAGPPVSAIATVPGQHGVGVALLAEVIISFLMMWTVLQLSNSRRLAGWTPYAAGLLVTLFIAVEAPLSGMSMNPARSLASALASGTWTAFWIYLVAPVLGMQAATATFLLRRRRVACAKLLHDGSQRCIHCGYRPDHSPRPDPLLRGVNKP